MVNKIVKKIISAIFLNKTKLSLVLIALAMALHGVASPRSEISKDSYSDVVSVAAFMRATGKTLLWANGSPAEKSFYNYLVEEHRMLLSQCKSDAKLKVADQKMALVNNSAKGQLVDATFHTSNVNVQKKADDQMVTLPMAEVEKLREGLLDNGLPYRFQNATYKMSIPTQDKIEDSTLFKTYVIANNLASMIDQSPLNDPHQIHNNINLVFKSLLAQISYKDFNGCVKTLTDLTFY